MLRSILPVLLALALLSGCAAPAPQIALATPTTANQAEPAATLTPLTVLAPSPTAEVIQPTAETEPTAPPAPESQAGSIAYSGADGNVWLVNPSSGEMKQLTQDAAPSINPNTTAPVDYCCMEWSSDGRLLAFYRQAGTPVEQGMQFAYSLWVYDAASGETRLLLDQQSITGFAWKPLTHLIAYGLPVEPNYFVSRGGVAAELARGIAAVDADSGAVLELVKPERGFTLVNPNWSPDGRFVSFEEVLYMEGRGSFAYYDLEEQKYTSWEKPIGGYDWSPDSAAVVYDTLTYAPSGTERIFRSSREGADEQPLSPDFEPGYAFSPVYAPQGDWVAYLAELGDPSNSQYKLFVQSSQDGEPRELGTFEQPGYLGWSPDGQSLVLGVGPFGSDTRQIVIVSAADGSVKPLVKGSEPAWQPAVP